MASAWTDGVEEHGRLILHAAWIQSSIFTDIGVYKALDLCSAYAVAVTAGPSPNIKAVPVQPVMKLGKNPSSVMIRFFFFFEQKFLLFTLLCVIIHF